MSFRRIVTNTLARAGVSINGDKPWDIQVLRDRFYRRAARGALGLGDSYVDRDWDVASLDGLFRHIIAAGLRNSRISKMNRVLGEPAPTTADIQYMVGSLDLELFANNFQLVDLGTLEIIGTVEKATGILVVWTQKLLVHPMVKVVVFLRHGYGAFPALKISYTCPQRQ